MATLSGGTGNDKLTGGTAVDSISGLAGNDQLYGADGADTVSGGDGGDLVYGGNADDAVYGGASYDQLYGDAGNDQIYGGTDTAYDDIYGGAGNDTIFGGNQTGAYGTYQDDWVWGDDGNDLANLGGGSDAGYGGTGNDTLLGGDGNDLLQGDAGADSLAGEAGDDLLAGGADNDSLSGGTGADTLTGDAGADGLTGDAGADSLSGGDGDDTGYGGAEGDALSGDAGNDALYGGDGTDGVSGGAGNDLLSGDGGTDKLDGGEGADTLYGGAEGDALSGGTGSDLLSGGAGDDTVLGGDDADRITVAEGDGQDQIQGGEGGKGTDADQLDFSGKSGVTVSFSDSEAGAYKFEDGTSGSFTEIEGVTGTDAGDRLDASGVKGAVGLSGAGGDDTLAGGHGDDTLTGGEGSDSYGLGGGSDIVTDFDLTEVKGHTTDQLDVSELTNPDGSPVKAWDVKVSPDGDGNAVLTFPEGETVTLKGVTPEMVEKAGGLGKMGVPCFAGGSRIAVPGGWRAVEAIGPGDLVLTEAGPARVIWHGRKALDAAALEARPEQRPIRLKAGHFGLVRDLVVSPQHGILVGGALIRARHLADWGKGAHVARGVKAVVYHHLMLPSHGLLLAEGARAESFYPGVEALRMLPAADRAALARALGRVMSGAQARAEVPGTDLEAAYGPRCLPLLNGPAARAHLAGVRVTA